MSGLVGEGQERFRSAMESVTPVEGVDVSADRLVGRGTETTCEGMTMVTSREGRTPGQTRGRMSHRPRRRGDAVDGTERGASIVEFAFVAPVLLALVFGIIDYGMVLSDTIGLRQGVREAARAGTVAEFGSTSSCGASLTGSPTTEMKKLVCLAKSRSDVPASQVRVAIRFDPASSGLAASAAYPGGTGSPPVGNGLIVCSIAPQRSITGFYSPMMRNRYIRSKVVMRIEKAVGTAQIQTNETDPSGANWSWCTP